MRTLPDLFLSRKISAEEFLKERMIICPFSFGEVYPDYIQIILHYFADSGRRSGDKGFVAALQKRILLVIQADA